MAGDGPKCPKCAEGAPDYMLTYGDMVTLLLAFFVTMFAVSDPVEAEFQVVLSAFSGLGNLDGGNTLQQGKLAELGNNLESLPSTTRGRALDKSRKTAVSLFQPEILSKKVRVTEDERGLVISLASDAFYEKASAEIRMDEARSVLQRLALLLSNEEIKDRKVRIEGHTDSAPTDPFGEFPSNWELSTARSTNILRRLLDYGVVEKKFQVAGFSDTVPLADNATPEGQAYNRRVDVVVLSSGHL